MSPSLIYPKPDVQLLHKLGLNQGNHDRKASMIDGFRLEFDYPINSITEPARDERQARDWMQSARARALPDWIEIRLIQRRRGRDRVLERFNHTPEQTPEERVLDGDLNATPGDYWCKRCGRDEIDARANGCSRGPCPMEPKRPVVFAGGQAVMLLDRYPPDSILVYDCAAGDMVYIPQSRMARAVRPFLPVLLVSLGMLALIGLLAIFRGPV